MASLLAVLCGGCGGDGTTDRLPDFSGAVLVSRIADDVYVTDVFGGDEEMPRGLSAAVGTKVVVIDDRAKDVEGDDRKARVRIEEGKYRGYGGHVRRSNLRASR